MTAVAAHAFGLPAADANSWLEQEHLRNVLSSRERVLLSCSKSDLLYGQMEVHAIYALAWCTSLVDGFSANGKLRDDLVTRLPDLRRRESTRTFRARLTLRKRLVILKQLDQDYCFH